MLQSSLSTLFTMLICFIVVGFIQAQPTPPAGFKWEPVPEITDEFDKWDDSKWFKSLWNYGEPVQMRAENSGVSDGNLWIKATLDSGAIRWFETSRVYSRAQMTYPMYTECSMKTAHISAYNTFWMNNGDINNRDEIDICENNSKPSRPGNEDWPYLMQSQYFLTVNRNDERAKGNFDNRNLSDSNPKKGIPWNEEYHTLGVWWKDKNNVQFYLDGEPAGSVTTTRDFTRKLNIIWDLWTIDQWWSGGVAAQEDLLNDSINTMKIDWIHTYTLVEDITTSITNNDRGGTDVNIFPNPVSDKLTIDLPDFPKENATVQIYDSIGKLVQTNTLNNKQSQISLTNLPPSIYIVKIFNGGAIHCERVVKE